MATELSSLAEAPAVAPFIQITKRGAVISAAGAEIATLRRQFTEQHWLLLPKFAEATLLELIERKLNQTDYRVVDRETGVELRPIDCTAYLATELLLNSPPLFRAIEALTGCDRIACFSGRIYRRPPASEYFNRWHTDVNDEGRMIALSINLSTQPYSGGALHIRSSKTKELLGEVENPRYGDALIFFVDERFEHRVGRVEGETAKTALAGWFRSKFDPNSLFGRGLP
ncbi:MAG TPA: 2OG-Fe(II) oxygenase [Pyrinomonadaceae bacterium]|nr:2OG-Fe(II) oxygenase [Pyrinomonadaceae bacterium]